MQCNSFCRYLGLLAPTLLPYIRQQDNKKTSVQDNNTPHLSSPSDTLKGMLRANPSHASLRDRLLELMARQVLPVCDAAGHSVTEMIYAELLQRFPTIVTNNHPEFWIRFNLNGAISHCLKGVTLHGKRSPD